MHANSIKLLRYIPLAANCFTKGVSRISEAISVTRNVEGIQTVLALWGNFADRDWWSRLCCSNKRAATGRLASDPNFPRYRASSGQKCGEDGSMSGIKMGEGTGEDRRDYMHCSLSGTLISELYT